MSKQGCWTHGDTTISVIKWGSVWAWTVRRMDSAGNLNPVCGGEARTWEAAVDAAEAVAA